MSNQSIHIRYILLFVFFVGSFVYGQEKLGELSISDLTEKKVIVRSADKAALIVISEVADLQFESTRLIHAVRQRGASEWQLLLEPGRQIITVRAPGYQPVKTDVINIPVKRAFSIKVSQVRAVPGKLIVSTEPGNADILINGAKIAAKTPFVLEEALPGQFNIEVQKEGYRPAFKSLLVKSSQTTNWDVELTQTAVRVQIELENDELKEVGVLINGEPKGLAPGAIFLEPGSYQLVLQKPGFQFPEKVIDIEFGPEEITLSEKLIPLKQPFYKQWWFFAGTAAVATTAAILLSGDQTGQKSLTSDPPSFPGQ